MSEAQAFRLRVTFRKSGRLALLSHLEVARALERTVRRAGLPFAVSQGFSPHMKIAFGAALPVGVGGTQECFDLYLTRYIAPEKAREALEAASVADLMPSSCEYLGNKAPAPSVAYPVSTYLVELAFLPKKGEPGGTEDKEPGRAEGLNKPCVSAELLVPPETVLVKRKNGEKELASADFLVGPLEGEGNMLRFSLRAHASGSLRVDAFVAALLAAHPDLEASAITRIAQRPV
ncbi:MAG: TIGR03936 family radical SAM-associated protein [Coriobacteriaceae bacterium]|jgi:radical SAM-linked protein|nr:TIGR03936 family radical SAM-associated protein [Coriobacteriaceae bacterium]